MRFSISVTLNPAQRARDSNPQDPPEGDSSSDSILPLRGGFTKVCDNLIYGIDEKMLIFLRKF